MNSSHTGIKKRSKLERYFESFRNNIVGFDHYFEPPYGRKKIIYVDWTASGRFYRPIDEKLLKVKGPFRANTHTETSISGSVVTHAYHDARNIIKKHVNASKDDVLITVGTGITGAINKFQRILGIKLNENLKDHADVPEDKQTYCFCIAHGTSLQSNLLVGNHCQSRGDSFR